MGYFPVRYNSRVVIYERKMFIRLATEVGNNLEFTILQTTRLITDLQNAYVACFKA